MRKSLLKVNECLHIFQQSHPELIQFGVGYLFTKATTIIPYSDCEKCTVPLGSILFNPETVAEKSITHVYSQDKTIEAMSHPHAVGRLSKSYPDIDSFLYLNKSSGKLVNTANELISNLITINNEEELSLHLSHFKTTIQSHLTPTAAFAREIDNNTSSHEKFIQSIDTPSTSGINIISNHDITTEFELREDLKAATQSIYELVLSDKTLRAQLAELNPYYNKYKDYLLDAFKGVVSNIKHSLLTDNQDFFPSNNALIQIRSCCLRLRNNKKLQDEYKKFILEISSYLCNTYIFLELFDAFILKATKPDTILCTKYSQRAVYTDSIKVSLSLVSAAIKGKLNAAIGIIKAKGLSVFCGESASITESEAIAIGVLDSGPLFKSLIKNVIGHDELYSHQVSTKKYNRNTGQPASVKLTPNPFTDTPPSSIIIMTCFHEIFANQTTLAITPNHEPLATNNIPDFFTLPTFPKLTTKSPTDPEILFWCLDRADEDMPSRCSGSESEEDIQNKDDRYMPLLAWVSEPPIMTEQDSELENHRIGI